MKRALLGMLLLVMVVTACKKDNDKTPLVAALDGELIEALEGDTVTFRDASQGQAARWKWTFEGGSPETSELSSPSVIYHKAGKYKVTLEISNAGQTSTVTKENFVSIGYNDININFSADKLTIIEGQSATFTDKSTGIPTTWAWEFIHETQGVLYTSTERNPTIQFNVPGKYSVKLKASNPGHIGEKTVSQFIEVIDRTVVNAEFKASSQITYAGGAAITFEDISLGNVEARTWTFEGGTPATSTDARPSVSYNTPGRYRVTLSASNSFRTSDTTIDRYILVVPADNLMALLPFNNSAVDIGPLNMGVTIQGTLAFNQPDRNSVAGHTATFDGVASGVVLQSNGKLNLGTSDFSVACWVKTDSAGRMMIWQESGRNGGKDNQAWLRINDNATQLLRFNTEDASGNGFLNVGAPGKINDDKWYHVVGVRQGLKNLVYINGKKIGEATITAVRNVSGAQNFKIGLQEGVSSFSNFFNGQIDDFVIYKRALTAAEIAMMYE